MITRVFPKERPFLSLGSRRLPELPPAGGAAPGAERPSGPPQLPAIPKFGMMMMMMMMMIVIVIVIVIVIAIIITIGMSITTIMAL